jgi:hypothetical protein
MANPSVLLADTGLPRRLALPSPAQWRASGHFIQWQGHRIFVRDDNPAGSQSTVWCMTTVSASDKSCCTVN